MPNPNKYSGTLYEAVIERWYFNPILSQKCPHSSIELPICTEILENANQLYRHIEHDHPQEMRHQP